MQSWQTSWQSGWEADSWQEDDWQSSSRQEEPEPGKGPPGKGSRWPGQGKGTGKGQGKGQGKSFREETQERQLALANRLDALHHLVQQTETQLNDAITTSNLLYDRIFEMQQTQGQHDRVLHRYMAISEQAVQVIEEAQRLSQTLRGSPGLR